MQDQQALSKADKEAEEKGLLPTCGLVSRLVQKLLQTSSSGMKSASLVSLPARWFESLPLLESETALDL